MLTDLTYSDITSVLAYMYCDKYVDSNLALALKCVCASHSYTHTQPSGTQHPLHPLSLCDPSRCSRGGKNVLDAPQVCHCSWRSQKYDAAVLQIVPLRTLTSEPLLFPTSPHTPYSTCKEFYVLLVFVHGCTRLHKAVQDLMSAAA